MDSRNGAVGVLYADYLGLVSDLDTSPSGLVALSRSFHKHLLLAAASSLEDEVKVLVTDIFDRYGSDRLARFVEKRVMARGYHTLFDWQNGSAQGFFRSFGDSCASAFRARLRDDSGFRERHDAFMALGNHRNELVHNDYASAFVELTPDEIMRKYDLALEFVEEIESLVFAE